MHYCTLSILFFILLIIFAIVIVYLSFCISVPIYKTAVKYVPAQCTGSFQKIPYIIVQTNEDDYVSEKMYAAMQAIRDMNPEYEYKYFSNSDRINYILENFGQESVDLYNILVPGAYRSDYFRICYMYKDGGVYLDSGYVAIKPLSQIINSEHELIMVKDGPTGELVFTSFLCSIPNHEFFSRVLEHVQNNIRKRLYTKCPLGPTGPRALGVVFKKLYGKILIKNYDNNMKIGYHNPFYVKNTGDIVFDKQTYFKTKYEGYEKEPKKGGYYGKLWRAGKIYKN